MFATSTKTATFLPTGTPSGSDRSVLCARDRAFLCPSCRGANRGDGALHHRPGRREPEALPAGALLRITRLLGLDDRAALVVGRTKDLLEEAGGEAIGIMLRVHHQQVHRADVAARA